MFENRYQAGLLLSKKLQKYKEKKDVLVLGIPRGGIVVAKSLAEKIGLPLGAVVAKKIGAPLQNELAIGAVGPEGAVILDNKLISELGVSYEYLESQAKEKTDEIIRKILIYESGNLDLLEKTIILVDDGIATGATVKVAIKYLRKKKVKKIILAVPVIPKSALLKFGKLADEAAVLHAPFSFNAVGQFYKDFPQVSDTEVIELLRN